MAEEPRVEEPAPAEEEGQESRTAFALFNTSDSGAITKEELRAALQSLGEEPTEDELKLLISEVDTNNNGMVEFAEFKSLMDKQMRDTDTEEELIEAFRVFDRDGNGQISPAELRHVMSNLGEKLGEDEIEKMIADADDNGDGQINYEEFIKMMMEK